MGQSVHFSVQTFQEDHNGKIARGRYVTCPSAAEAERYAERAVANRHADGAAAFSRRASEFDDAEPITLAVFGKVPAGVEETIPF